MYNLSGYVENMHGSFASSSIGNIIFGNPIIMGIILTMTTLILMHRLYDDKKQVSSYRKVMLIASLLNVSYLFFSIQLLTTRICKNNTDDSPMAMLEGGREHIGEEFDL